MTRRLVARLLLSLVVFGVTAEVLGLLAFYWDTGHLFYLYRKPVDPLFEERDRRLTGEALHPYFGVTHKPGYAFDPPASLARSAAAPRLATNNYGFIAAQDYPVARTSPRQYFIGIFGGSVGVFFCGVGVPRLVDELSRDPVFRDRELVPLCFSHEGYKQPQQLQVLSYFLSIGQPLDLVINIDGFNEVALSAINDQRGIDIAMPSSQHLEALVNLANRFTLTPDKLQSLAAIARDREAMTRLAGRIERNRSAAVNIVLEWSRASAQARYAAELVRFEALPSNPSEHSIIQVVPRRSPAPSPAVFEAIARHWATASVLMHDLLAARRIPYLHVLQPNQYFTSRQFGDDERRAAINPASAFKRGAEQGYPALLAGEAQATLAAGGVHFVDATRIFDDERAPVYIDDCCHYTRRGYELLADAIAAAVR